MLKKNKQIDKAKDEQEYNQNLHEYLSEFLNQQND